ncbi:hypothetical protein BLJ79_15710 [Arthrobacter sp. UCD-GKA]|uniref:hypothetical protein n=1 Tax=Arthrobacter sp. UCD-GKA TaxID=1913576 RepID=UPI0008DE8273|nr:hypothetical protein [Arthrobacter sp. UCD-GKA]OIH83507.1 hypothetical protein BLJ79_15710 [Arthrobacter sp. UCD-GKA]
MSKTFLVALGAMALAGVVLILSIPALFGQHQPYQEQLTGWAGGLFVVFTAIVVSLRISARRRPRPAGNK